MILSLLAAQPHVTTKGFAVGNPSQHDQKHKRIMKTVIIFCVMLFAYGKIIDCHAGPYATVPDLHA